jgi:hypothetical protein
VQQEQKEPRKVTVIVMKNETDEEAMRARVRQESGE